MEKENFGYKNEGHYHPLTHIMRDIVTIFCEMGFDVADGPEMETEYYNFDALNIRKDHPARDMWDTFWVKPKEKGLLMRTHTSPVQVRFMEKKKPPLAVIVPGKVFRYEATDATHEAQFYQLEGLVVGENISLGDLKYVLGNFFHKFFGKELKFRFRPSYFPFVEPGVEVDVSCFKCGGSGKITHEPLSSGEKSHIQGDQACNLCKKTGWIELMGGGMVHKSVLGNAGIDFRKWQGFAFGVGIDRLAMLKYEIPDIRLFYNGDLRVVNQF